MNVLIVEDESELLKKIAVLAESGGYNVRTVASIEALKTILKTKNFGPSVIILDRILNGVDSVHYIPQIKSTFGEAKLLVLSAIDTATEKAAALNAGADDYLAKPFSSVELMARVNALARRSRLYEDKATLQLGQLSLNRDFRSVKIGQQSVDVSNKEFLLLFLFCSNPGKVFSKEVLLEQVWQSSDAVETKVVEVTINNLRRKLESGSDSVRIKNMRNVGYWLET